MITAVDTSVLLDVLTGDPAFGRGSLAALEKALVAGRVVVSEVVLAEVRACFPDDESGQRALTQMGASFAPSSAAVGLTAGRLWRDYCHRHPKRDRSRVVADFLVGAHARHHADALLTRDRGFYRESFADLAVLDPTA
jgi:predicted nucleic acid-binding protein